MKRGKLRVAKDYQLNVFRIQGRKNGVWVDVWDEEREKRGLTKELIFDLKYDACGYLQGLLDWIKDMNMQNKTAAPNQKEYKNMNKMTKSKRKTKTRKKIANESKKRNRKK